MSEAEATRLYEGQLTGSAVTLFTAKVRTVIRSMRVTNVTGSAATATLNLVPKGGTAGATNEIVAVQSIAANTSVDLMAASALGAQVLNPGDFLSGLAGTASALDLLISGDTHGEA